MTGLPPRAILESTMFKDFVITGPDGNGRWYKVPGRQVYCEGWVMWLKGCVTCWLIRTPAYRLRQLFGREGSGIAIHGGGSGG